MSREVWLGLSRYSVGLLFIVVVAVIWTFSSVLVQYIFDNLDFRSPLFLTYVCTSLFSVQLPLFFGLEALGITQTIAWSRTGENRRLLTGAAAAEAAASSTVGADD